MSQTIVFGIKVEGVIQADTQDEAMRALVHELEPRVEVHLGLAGVSQVRFSSEYVRYPHDGDPVART